MPPIVSIVGKSKSGKTTLVEKLIPELKRRGYRIGTIKHAHHGFTLDQKGKDSARHRAAGADAVIVSSPRTMAMVRDQSEESIENLSTFLKDMDLIIVEGYKRMDQPKIEVCRVDNHKSPIDPPPSRLIAFVSDMDIHVPVPQFGLEEIGPLADLIETRFLGTG
jgi:molybdopterin-guanine dinucleotide biosynthesis protein B